MDALWNDVRYATRRLLRSPAFTLVAVLTLALGIGANSAIFSVVNGVLLRPLAFPHPEQLVRVDQVNEKGEPLPFSGPTFLDLERQSRDFSGVAAMTPDGFALTGAGDPVQVDGESVSAGFFQVLGVRPALGRTFRPDENQPGNAGVVVLGNSLWKERFGGDASVVGRVVTLEGEPFTVVGVMPAGFDYPGQRQLWVPLRYDTRFSSPNARGGLYLDVVARARPGVTAQQATADAARVVRKAGQDDPGPWSDWAARATPLRDAIVGDLRTPLLVLLGAVGFVLLIACANVANLMLARGAATSGELAVRAALGAGRGRIVAQLLTEGMVLAFMGGALGLLLGVWGLPLLLQLQPQGMARMQEVGIDGSVAAFTFFVAAVTGLLFGLAPALQASRPDLTGALRAGGRGGMAGLGSTRLRAALVVAEVALAVMLLTGAGLLLRSFGKLVSVDPGFRPQQTLAFSLQLPATGYDDDARVRQFYGSLLERLRAVPGVRAVAAVEGTPLEGFVRKAGFSVEGEVPDPQLRKVIRVKEVTPDYFRTLAIPLRRGRAIEASDRDGSRAVVVLNEAAVRRWFPGQDPVGKRIDLTWQVDSLKGPVGGVVVGIVGDTRQQMDQDPQPELYLAHAQAPAARAMDVVLRTSVEPLSLARIVQQQVASLDPNLPVSDLRTLEQDVSHSVSRPRFYTVLLGIFAAVALALASVGIFGVISYSVLQRRREIGIRMALGARPATVMGMVLGGAARLALGGVAIGLVGALALTRLMHSLLFGVSATDPLTFLGVALALGVVALAAGFFPARAAIRVDPQTALRTE